MILHKIYKIFKPTHFTLFDDDVIIRYRLWMLDSGYNFFWKIDFSRRKRSMPLLKNVPDIRTKPMREIIYEHLRKAILRGELKTDSTFTDAEIAQDFGVSRTPVREAVQKLEADGFIERISMKGNRVRGISPYELAHCLAVRKAIETLAVRYTALRITAEELEQLRDLLEEADRVFAKYSGEELLERFFPVVKSFNHVVFEACRSKILTTLIWTQREVFDRYRVMRITLPNRPHKSLSRRKELYMAFMNRDHEKACAVWTEHLNESFAIWREKSGLGKDLEDFMFF